MQIKTDDIVLTNDKNFKRFKRKRVFTLKNAFNVLFIFLMIFVLAFTLGSDLSRGEKVDFSVIKTCATKNYTSLIILISLFSYTLFGEGLKILIMIKGKNAYRPLITAFNASALGKYYDYLTPLGSGGQPFEIYYLTKRKISGSFAGAVTVTSFLLTQFAFFNLSIIAFIIGGEVPKGIKITAYFGAFSYILIPLCLIVFTKIPKLGEKITYCITLLLCKLKIYKDREALQKCWLDYLNGYLENFKLLSGYKRTTLICFLISLSVILATASMPYFVLTFLGANVNIGFNGWLNITVITFYIYGAITFIPTPGNSGAADGAFYWIFSGMLASPFGFTGMIIWRIFSYYLYLLVGLLCVLCRKKSPIP